MDTEGTYYYFVSSLPYLYLGQEPPLTSSGFLNIAVGVMEPETLAQLSAVSLVPREFACCEGEAHWNNFETFVRNYLGRERASRLKKDYTPWARREGDAFPLIKTKLDEALNAEDPVQQEWMLDSTRWWFLDHITADRAYRFDAVVTYRVKLLLTEKWAVVSKEAGQEHLQELINEVWQEAERVREDARSTQ